MSLLLNNISLVIVGLASLIIGILISNKVKKFLNSQLKKFYGGDVQQLTRIWKLSTQALIPAPFPAGIWAGTEIRAGRVVY